MLRLAKAAVRRPKFAIGLWLLVIVALTTQLPTLESRLGEPNYDVAGTEHLETRTVVDENFGANLQFPVLLTGPQKVLDARGPAYVKRLDRHPRTTVLSPWGARESGDALRPRPTSAMLVVIIDAHEDESLTAAREVKELVDETVAPPLKAHITGQQMIGLAQQEEAIESSERAELIALPILLVVLLLVFRSVVAALIPALFGACILAGSFGALSLLALLGSLSVSALSLSSMMSLALGIDYSLLLVARFREELADGSSSQDSAVAAFKAATTAGRTVAFAALTLTAAMLTGLLLAPGSFLVSAVIGVGVAVTLSAVSAIVVIPAVLTLLGTRINSWSLGRGAGASSGRAAAVARRALARPALAAGAVLLPLLAFGSQALAIDPGTPGADLLPADNRARQDLEAVTKEFGPGWSVPFEVVAEAPKGPITVRHRLRQVERLQRTIATDRDVATVIGPGAISRRAGEIQELPRELAGLQKSLKSGRRDVKRLDAGLTTAHRGVRDVRAGLREAASGAGRLANGGADAEAGARSVADGVSLAATGMQRLVDALGEARTGAQRVAGGTREAETAARKLAAGLRATSKGLAGAAPAQARLEQGLRDGAGDLERLREPAQLATKELDRAWELLNGMSAGRLDPAYERTLEAVGRARGAVTGRHPVTGAPVQDGYDGLDASLALSAGELAKAADAVKAATTDTKRLTSGLVELRRGADRLNNGLDELGTGAGRLSTGIAKIRSEVTGSASDIKRLERGAQALGDGIGQLADGSTQLRAGLDDGATRSAPLESGIARIDKGVGRFRGKLESDSLSSTGPDGFEGALKSGHIVLAALDGSDRTTREQAQSVISLATGGRAARIFVIPKADASSPATPRLRERLSDLAGRFEKDTGLKTSVGGQGGLVIEYDEAVTARMLWLILGFVVITYLVLIPFFRALLLPAIAVLLNVLTVAASSGVLVLLFQGSAPLGGPGYIDAIVMVGIFGVIFGLSIDYQVFLLGRMREGWVRTRNIDEAVSFGLDRTASVVTGAAAIMLGVFFAFSLSDVVPTRQFGIGLFVAVLIDATIVRLVLLPAAMRLFGAATWYLPAWLDRILPRFDDEPAPEHVAPERMEIEPTPLPALRGLR